MGSEMCIRDSVKPARGRIALAPATLQRLTSNRDLSLEGSNKERRQSQPEVLPVPETVPASLNGKYISSQGTTSGILDTPAVAVDPPDFLPVTQGLPYQMEDGDDDL